MKIKDNQNTEISTNIDSSERIEATISNPAKMFKMFTKDLYKHPLQTAIQEYINNAKDAHTMIGKDPSSIEITAPTVANQSVIIKDFGPGLSPADIINVFSKITTSNKDNSDLFNGGFGIGSKSWFSVNSIFYVISRYNGIKSYYEVSFTDSIYIQKQHEESTDEPSGVEVVLPLANNSQISEAEFAIHRAVRFWKTRPKLINTEIPPLNPLFECSDFKIIELSQKEIHLGTLDLMVTLGETQYSISNLNLRDVKDLFPYKIEISFKVGEVQTKNSEVGPDRESFSVEMIPFINKKISKIREQLPTIILDALKKETSLSKILHYVSLPHFNIQNYVFNHEGINLVIIKSFRNSKIIFNELDNYYDGYRWHNKTPFLVPKGCILLKSRTIQSQKTKILKEIKKQGFNYVAFVDESSWTEEKERLYSNYFTIKTLDDFNLKTPAKDSDLINQENPEITVHSSGTFDENEQLLLNKEISIIPLLSLNKDNLIVSCGLYQEERTRIYLANANRPFYICNKSMTAVLSHFKFQVLSRETIQNDIAQMINNKKERDSVRFLNKIKHPITNIAIKARPLITFLYHDIKYVDESNNNRFNVVAKLFNKIPEFKEISDIDCLVLVNELKSFNNSLFYNEYAHPETFFNDFIQDLKENYHVLYFLLNNYNPNIINSTELPVLVENFIKTSSILTKT